MKLENEFTVSVPIEQAWQVLTDLEGIAPCMPGAVLTGRDGDNFMGKVKIKVGPVISEFAGVVHFIDKDDAAHRAVIDAKGKDSRGTGNVSATITAALMPQGEHTLVRVDTDMKISGKIAQLGSGMMKDVSEKLLGQFVGCLESKLSATDRPAPLAAAEPVARHSPADPLEPGPAATPQPRATTRRGLAIVEPEPLDLIGLAGGALSKRLVPVAVGAALVAVAVIVYRIVR